MGKDGKYIRAPNSADKIDAAQQRYFKSKKGKEAIQRYLQSDAGEAAKKRYFDSEKGKAALKRYAESEGGREALRKAAFKYYHDKKKPERELVQLCVAFLEKNPDKTIEDFIGEVSGGQDTSSR